jgi:GNAT superfamily N-acetyltransferase
MSTSVSIRPVRSKRELKRFVKVPFRLHRDRPQWVAPLIFERMEFLNREKNPFFEHAEAEYFLAERDGEPVGRISAQIDQCWDETQGGSDAMFGFFETDEDRQVTAALLEAACEWARSKGRSRILGPMDFTTNDEIGVLIEGYELRPMILENWHPPFYKELIEGEGFAKAMDLLMWELQFGDLKQGESFDPAIHAAAEKALHDEGVTIRNISLRNLPAEMRAFSEVYNEAWGSNWGFVPATDAEIEFHAKLLKQVLDEDWAYIAEKDGEPVGAALTLPDINQVMAKLNGRLLPFGWLKFLLGKRKIDQLRVFALGVKHDYRHSGVAAGLYLKHLETAAGPGAIGGGEMGWILETNKAMNRAMEGMGGKVVKKYRVYEKALAVPGSSIRARCG